MEILDPYVIAFHAAIVSTLDLRTKGVPNHHSLKSLLWTLTFYSNLLQAYCELFYVMFFMLGSSISAYEIVQFAQCSPIT